MEIDPRNRKATDIMALVERIEQTAAALQAAQQAKQVVREAFNVAEEVCQKAYLDFELAQNVLVVAAGGTDRSFMLGLNVTREAAAKESN